MLTRFCIVLLTVSVAVVTARHKAVAETASDGTADDRRIAARHKTVRDRTAGRFARAVIYFPTREGHRGDRTWMAPLVAHEVASTRAERASLARIGTLVSQPTAETSIDLKRATIYQTARRIRIGDRSYVQQSYLWFYSAAQDGSALRWRGFRQTLNGRGFAVVWESLSSDSPLRVFFVAKSLEKDAARRFGAPLPGRRYAIEPSCVDFPEAVVARAVGEGPQPMGPYVYVDQAALTITTMKCRCEPAQASSFSQNLYYRLVPVDSFSQLVRPTSGAPDLKLPADWGPLEGVLRLPPMR